MDGTFHSQSQREKKTPQHKNEVYRISHANPILSSRAPFSSSIQPRIASIFFLCPLFPKLKPPNNQPAVNVNSILNHCQDVVYKFVALLARYGSKSILKERHFNFVAVYNTIYITFTSMLVSSIDKFRHLLFCWVFCFHTKCL